MPGIIPLLLSEEPTGGSGSPAIAPSVLTRRPVRLEARARITVRAEATLTVNRRDQARHLMALLLFA